MASWNVPQGHKTFVGFTAPEMRISAPDYVDSHMILDLELAQLSKPETGVIGALGFTALGAVLGLAPSALALWDKAPKDLTHSDVIAGVEAAASLATAVVCLLIFAIASWRNRGLAGTIRARKKSGLGVNAKGLTPGL